MLNPRALMREAFHNTRATLGRFARKIVLALVLAAAALAATIYFFAGAYQALLPSLGAAGANVAIAAALLAVCLGLLAIIKRA